MAAPEEGTGTLLNPLHIPPCLPVVHILPPSSSTTTPTPLPVLVPSLSPTTDPCGDSVLQPAIFSPTAATVPGLAQPVRCGGPVGKTRDVNSLMEELSLQSEEELLAFVQEGLRKCAIESAQNSVQGPCQEEVGKVMTVVRERWAAGSLSPAVKSLLGSLVKALRDQNVAEARELHLLLVTSHSSEISDWSDVVKKMVQELGTKESRFELRRLAEQNHVFSDPPVTDKVTETGEVEFPASDLNTQAEGRR
ncbi:uncharacterized protein LOC143298653 [Babylonia areolata]|uniref:uncharacterized protein LOC143298653 n=1 Tax=Babylonia areolata TaxID=304850 RepID=UPI003FD51942